MFKRVSPYDLGLLNTILENCLIKLMINCNCKRNNPPEMLIPLPKDMMAWRSYPTIEEYSSITLATLNDRKFSRLVVTALASNIKIKLNKSIFVRLTRCIL